MNDLLVFAGLVHCYGLVSGRMSGNPVTAPMVFVAAGLALSAPAGSLRRPQNMFR